MSVPRTCGLREMRYQLCCPPRGTVGASFVPSGKTPPCLATASSLLATGPSSTSSDSRRGCVFQLIRIVPIHSRVIDVVLLQFFLHPLDGVVGEGLEGVLELHCHNQLRAAAQVQPEVDVIPPIRDELVLGLGQSDDAVNADQ